MTSTHDNDLIRVFETYLAWLPKKYLKAKETAGEFKFIPFSRRDFEFQLKLAYRLHPNRRGKMKFVDVGCGIGSKLILARHIFGWGAANITGIEITPSYAKIAQKILLVNNIEARVLQQDALKADYTDYDIIYFFCPLLDQVKQRQLEQRIIEQAKPGTVILANYKQGGPDLWDNSPQIERVWSDRIYRKRSTK